MLVRLETFASHSVVARTSMAVSPYISSMSGVMKLRTILLLVLRHDDCDLPSQFDDGDSTTVATTSTPLA